MSDVLMPQMGESIVEGTITRWLKAIGEEVERDEPLVEISTDKVDSEIPSPAAGVLQEILVAEGETVAINTLLARIGDGGPSSSSAQSSTAEPAHGDKPDAANGDPLAGSLPSSDAQPAQQGAAAQVRTSPLVRRLAKQHNIDLSQLRGSGQGGRISKKDVEAYLQSREAALAASPAGTADRTGVGPVAGVGTVAGADAFPAAPEARFGDFTTEPLGIMRQKIAEHMVLSKRHAPQVSTVHQIDCTVICKARDAAREKFLAQYSVKLTFMPFFLRAVAAALKQYPLINASLDGDQVIRHSEVNIGIAVALDGGLIVPVIHGADRQSVSGLQRSVHDLASRARGKQLQPGEVSRGTFSISNHGSYGSLLAAPAIHRPQSAILGLGVIHKAPVVVHDAIGIRSICYATLTFDHRLIDGAMADLFMTHLKGVIESWSEPII